MNHSNACADIDVKKIITDRPIMHMFDLQLLLQKRLGKMHNPEDSFQDISLKVIYWRQCIQAECDEMLEWFTKDVEDFDFQEVEMEVIDILHFVFNIGIAIGLNSAVIDRLMKSYISVHDKGIENTTLGSNEFFVCRLSSKLTKLIDLFPWKTWKTYKDPVPELVLVLEAYAAVIQANLELAAFNGMTMERIVSVYCAKNLENHRRQDNGY